MEENKYISKKANIIKNAKWNNDNDMREAFNILQMEEAREIAKKELFKEFELKLNSLRVENKELTHDIKVCEDEDIKQRDIINKHSQFNYKHRFIIKVLRFIDNVKLPRIKIEWRR